MRIRHGLAPLLFGALAFWGANAASADPKPSNIAAKHERIPTLEEARTLAQRTRRTLVLEFGARWCQPCKEFDKRVLSQPTVQQALSEVLFIHYDAEEAPGLPAARELKIVGYPTFLAIGQDGRVIDRLEGYRGAREFLDWLARIAIDWESDDSLQVRLTRDPNDAEALLLRGRRLAQRGQDAEAEAMLLRAEQAAQAVQGATSGPERPAKGADKNKMAQIAADADWEMRIVRLRRILREAPRKEMAEYLLAFPRGKSAEAAFRELVHRGPADALALQAIDRYVDLRIEGAAKGASSTEIDALNEAVYGCLRAAAYDAAERGARRLLMLDAQNPLFLDTLAEVLHLRGDRTQALALSARALAAIEKQGEGGKELRAVLLKNQARFTRAAHELPAELLEEEEELSPWERPVESRH